MLSLEQIIIELWQLNSVLLWNHCTWNGPLPVKLTAICRGGASGEYGRCFSPTVQLLFSTPLQAGTLFKCGGAILYMYKENKVMVPACL